jgi:hypothetical protein
MIDAIDWRLIRSIDGDSSYVPTAFRHLLTANSADEATKAYWELDNHVLVQGQLFDAALYVVPPLLVALHGEITSASRYRVAELLVEIALGVPHHLETAVGNDALADHCKDELRLGMWSVYALLGDSDERLRVDALDILDAIESNSPRLLGVVNRLVLEDDSPRVRARAEELRQERTSTPGG